MSGVDAMGNTPLRWFWKSLWRRMGPEYRYRANRVLDWTGERRIVHSIAPPRLLFVELASVCNLRCPLCPTGTKVQPQGRGLIHWDLFRVVVDNLGPYHPNAIFNMWGEPLLHPRAPEMIRYAKEKGFLDISINTNGNIDQSDQWIRELVTSGLDQLIVNIDGADQETYASYRKKGRLELVLDFFDKLDRAKKAVGSVTPRIVPLMIRNRFNQGQKEAIQGLLGRFQVEPMRVRETGLLAMADDVDAGTFFTYAVDSDGCNMTRGREGGLVFKPQSRTPLRLPCKSIWEYIHVTSQGAYVPCCSTPLSEPSFKGVADWLPIDFWYSRPMVEFRRANLDDPLSLLACESCSFIRGVRGIGADRPFLSREERNRRMQG
ncbi:MAG: radical SAM protein [Magnetococcales bacterium]|nr:radical SAM protein [Magnetococcales bacterium]MBF0157727.1 radical SAM protein [Magnetococcales bacterium]